MSGDPPWRPRPLDTSGTRLPADLRALVEVLAENNHDVWGAGRIRDGWRHGAERDDRARTNPTLVPYAELPESEKDVDRGTAVEVLKVLLTLGYRIARGQRAATGEDGAVSDSTVTTGKLLLVEYERLKEEQKTRIGFRDNLIYATLASMAGVVAATLAPRGHSGLLLLLPPVCVILGWTYLVNDEKVSALGRYLRLTLAPKLAELAGASDEDAPGIFGWEIAHRSDPDRRLRKVSQLVVDLGTFCLPAVSALVVFWVNGPHRVDLAVVSVAELLLVLALAVQIVRYADLARGR
ncbi:RyR domain-containing protein [Actinoplanes sp. NPDC051346]|uniref:RyR domain-containing protein n=1 Tax=Actinoplanes sp. NPDC051346 TaxID=3155048 RepID=UPI003429B726